MKAAQTLGVSSQDMSLQKKYSLKNSLILQVIMSDSEKKSCLKVNNLKIVISLIQQTGALADDRVKNIFKFDGRAVLSYQQLLIL